ncbi:MAG: glycine--tRNA ligase, partial [Minisyncoccia bacterium]
HIGKLGLADPVIECSICHEKIRADQPEAISEHEAKHKKEKIVWSEPKAFNLLVETRLGASEQTATKAYLRGEITQGVHVNFKNILDSMHPKLPFGVGQIGKAFRNEITPRDFLFRQREFEQMEIQYYIQPDEKTGQEAFEYWKQFALVWYQGLGFKKENLRLRQHAEDERAHYAKDAWDIEYNVPGMGWKEAWGIHHRGDWDFRRHSEFSGVDLSYFDDEKKERFIPWDIECSGGVDRAVLFTMLEAYTEDLMGGEVRPYLKLKAHLAPILCAVSPLLKNKPELVEKARNVFITMKNEFGRVAWDDNGNIGKRYRRQDEIGTPFCIVVDFDTLEDDTVTVRDRDTGNQERVKIADLIKYIKEKI